MISLDTIRIFILHAITFAWAFFALSDRGVKTAVNLFAIASVSVLGQFFLYWCWLPGLRAKSRASMAPCCKRNGGATVSGTPLSSACRRRKGRRQAQKAQLTAVAESPGRGLPTSGTQ